MSAAAPAGRGAVVTGAGRGLGAAIAGALARAGAGVVVAARTREEVERMAAELTKGGARARAVTCDVTDESDVRRLGAEAREFLGTVDILVNNAGAAGSAPLARIGLDDWNRMLATNATSAFLCTREFAPAMVERRWGRIVNVASIAGLRGARYIAHYAAAKHAVIGLTRSVALELESANVTVNAVCPGYADTPMTDRTLANVQARAGLTREQALAAVLESTGQTRLVAPGDVAAAVIELCSDAAAHRTGEAVVLGLPAEAS